MKKNDKVSELINSLVHLTKDKNVEWNTIIDYIEKNRNQPLKYYMIINDEYYDTIKPKKQYLIEHNSYCTQIKSGVVYLFSYYDTFNDDIYYILSVQNVTSSSIIELNTKETYQDEIRTLLFHIKNQFDNIDLFVDYIISEGKSIE